MAVENKNSDLVRILLFFKNINVNAKSISNSSTLIQLTIKDIYYILKAIFSIQFQIYSIKT